jgi:transcriptional regulator with XRE-family HTH domain
MSRYEQRKRRRLRDPAVATGYWEMDSELQLIDALDAVRQHEGITIEELARRMESSHPDSQRVVLSRLFNAEQPNPTLETLTRLLHAMNITAVIHLRRAGEGEPPIRVDVDLPDELPA